MPDVSNVGNTDRSLLTDRGAVCVSMLETEVTGVRVNLSGCANLC